MSLRKYINNAPTTTVVGAINSSVTSFTVTSLAGFPSTYPFTAVLGLGTVSSELVLVTGAVGSVPTVTRNYDGQGAFSHPASETFDHVAAAIDYSEANTHVNASSAVHGLTGSVVGTTDIQTLTNKTFTSPVVNTPTINTPTTSNATNTGDATHPALVGKATTAGGKTLSLQNSSAVEKASVDDAGNATFNSVATLSGGGVAPTASLVPYAGLTTPSGWLLCDGSAVSRTTYAALYAALCKAEKVGSLASSGGTGAWVGTLTVASSTGWLVGDRVTGPGFNLGVDPNANVIATIPDGTHITFASAALTSPFSTTTSQTYVIAPYGNGDASTTFNVPDLRDRVPLGVNTNLPGSTGTGAHTHPLSSNGQAQIVVDASNGGTFSNGVLASYTATRKAAATVTTVSQAEGTAAALQGATDSANAVPPFQAFKYIVKT